MKIPSNCLEAFLEVAREKQFTRAARNLGLTQSALSQRILNLEKLLEASLFQRDRSGTRLTEAVENLLVYAQTQEALEEEFLGTKKGEGIEGTLRIAAFSSVMRSLVLPALAPLLSEHPVRCTFITKEMNELPGLATSGGADFVIHDQELSRAGFESHFLGYEENVLVRAKKRNIAKWYLDHDAEDPTTARYLQKFGVKGKSIPRRFLDDVYGLIDGARLGLGEAVIPRHLVAGAKDLEIVSPEKVLRSAAWLILPNHGYHTRLQTKVIELIRSEFGRRLPQK